MNTFKSLILFLSLAWTFPDFTSAAFAGELKFKDRTHFGNFSVYVIRDGGQQDELGSPDGEYVLPFDDSDLGKKIKFGIRFEVPTTDEVDKFSVRNAQTMQIPIEIKISEEILGGAEIPVFYFECIGKCGFDQIDPIQDSNLDRVFERFFKASLSAEHYYLRLNSRDNPESRRSIQLWRDASFSIATKHLNWWLMTSDIVAASQKAFVDDQTRHLATKKYFAEANNDQ